MTFDRWLTSIIVGLIILNCGEWNEELFKGKVSQFWQNCCFSVWRNGIGKLRSWSEIVDLMFWRG